MGNTGNLVHEIAADLRARYEDTDMWLGSLCTSHIPSDFNVSLSEWMEGIKGTVIEDLTPTPPRNVDGFKRAVASVRGKQVKIGGRVWRFMPRSAGHDEDDVYRNITIEELDAEDHVLHYDKAVEFIYDRHRQYIRKAEINQNFSSVVPHEVRIEIQNRVDQVHKAFKELGGYLGPVKIRQLIRNDIEHSMGGIPAKPDGGLYFVFPQHLQRLEAIETLLNGFGCYFGIIPLVRDDKRREMMRKAFEEDSMATSRRLMKEMKDLLESEKGVTVKKAQALHKEYLTLQTKLASYSDHLGSAMEETGTALRALQAQSIALFKKVNK